MDNADITTMAPGGKAIVGMPGLQVLDMKYWLAA